METSWLGDQRDLVGIDGPDAATFLQSQASQDLRAMAVGESRWTFLLQPTGRVDVLARVERSGESTFLFDIDRGFGQILIDRLNRFKIRIKAAVAPVDNGSGSVPADEDARIAACWPKMGAEIVPGETIPAETGLAEVAVSFTKGCYPGQELVERMDSRGSTAPRFIRRLRGEGSVTVGDEVVHAGKSVGSLTSVAETDEGWAALALIARSTHPGDTVTAGSALSVVEDTSAR
jgi:folate-binding protein YgfZ